MKKKETPEPAASLLGIESETLKSLCLDIISSGFLERGTMEEKYGASVTTGAIAVLYRTHRVLREVRRPTDRGELLGYEWADKRFSKSETKNLPPALGFVLELTTNYKPKYGDFVAVSALCRWTSKCLGAVPMKDEQGQEYNGFERDEAGDVLIPPNCPRAMMQKVLPFIGRERSVAFHIGYENVIVSKNAVMKEKTKRGLVDPATGQGQGLRFNEAIAPGTEFRFNMLIPTSTLSVSDWGRAIQLAGSNVRFSPASSSAYGSFVVLKIE